MAIVEKISVALTAEQVDAIKSVVAAGDYASSSEVIREALRDWQDRRLLRDAAIARARALWDEGLASGSGVLDGMSAVKTEARRRHAIPR